MHSIIFFPVRGYIKKFLNHRFGKSHTYCNGSILAPIIRSVISSPSKSPPSDFESPHFYEVKLPESYLSTFNVQYSSEKIYEFNNDVNSLFREELFQFMIMNKDIYNIKYRTSLRDFLIRCEITETEMKLETLLRAFQRYLPKKEDRIMST